ncbi:Cell cycle serine/threonine-protein kinase cdc5/MSD2 [Elasticomyces elasticus]|nr:Cell cycle serine/threonine-protein kinase cdc5/MSD2 [Elasticomyces elasticus]KAK4971689.1 Cell cycle serine/threonine-protein kinase cdc5/MSD2 [Elasticomyces elasticus]
MSSVHADPPPPIVTEPTGINYATGPALGKGGFAICHRAERYDGSKPTGHLVALKIVKTKMEPAKLAQKFVSELQIHSKLAHPNIVAFYRAFSFQTSTYVVLELCPNGSLADMLKKRKQLTLPEIRRFVIQICGAVKYLHHRHIVHRDLKTGNLFLDENMNVKVGDFGLAALLVTEKEMEVKRRTTMCGTPNYLAPEILEKGKGHDEKVDLWAIGVIAYTLAIGKAPFHATTKEEIYKKLKSGNYSWPELSATTNQSADLRDLVASLLVPEEQRPLPDQIVSQTFFKIAYVPASIPSSAREKTPTWPEVTVPSADTIRRGYSETWFAICKESGVGEYTEGKCFALNGGRRVKSVVYDMEREANLGTQPTMPIPKDVVYISTVSSWDPPRSREEKPSREEKRPSSRSAGLRVISQNEVAGPRPEVRSQSAARDAEMMPPPSRPQSRTARTGTVRRAARTISEESSQSSAPFSISSGIEVGPVQMVRPREAPLTATSALKEMNNSSSSTSRSGRSQQSYESDGEKSKPARTVQRSVDATLARRPRAPSRATSRAPKSERSISPAEPGPFASLDELARVSPIKASRKKAAEAEVIEILSDPEPEVQSAPTGISLPPPPVMRRKLPVPKKASYDKDCVPGTDPETVLARLRTLQNNLASALSNQSPASSSSQPAPESLPFVTRWVDYSRKHGVGFVMSDGTVGVVLNASAKNKTPVTHVMVRDGQRWLTRVGKNFEKADCVPLEILEDRGVEGLRRKVYKGLGSVKEGPLAAEAERRRTLSVLWAKFGRYMCEALDGDEVAGSKNDGNFVRFYQRIGSVGIWAYSDGSLQVHFPDHTKIVLSAAGTHISATLITPEAISYLASHGDLLEHHVGGREVFVDSVQSLLHEGGRIRARVVKANQLEKKLGFISKVVEQWTRNQGLGLLAAEEFLWDGLMVQAGKKTDRTSVGRYGGDDNRK